MSVYLNQFLKLERWSLISEFWCDAQFKYCSDCTRNSNEIQAYLKILYDHY